jgi:LuxR family maltose regulon positive regulatory protein
MIHEIRLDQPLNSHLSSHDYADAIALARLLLARGQSQRNNALLAQALTLLGHLRQTVGEIGFNGWLLEIEMLTALALQAQGRTKRALTTLGPVLAKAESEGYLRLFADEGQAMQYLLIQIAPYTSASPSYLQKLQHAILPDLDQSGDQHPEAQQPSSLIDPLSAREQEVLHLLAAGNSNQQIAHQLVISLHTVKLHVKHILAKLGVTNRTQAVARARELHLL